MHANTMVKMPLLELMLMTTDNAECKTNDDGDHDEEQFRKSLLVPVDFGD